MTIILGVAALLVVPVGVIVVSFLPKRPHEAFLDHWESDAGQAEFRRVLYAAERAQREPMPAAWASSLSADEIEAVLLEELRAKPGDPEIRMVYADWLEQHGDEARASFVRGVAVGDLDHTDLEWRAVAARVTVPHHACGDIDWANLAVVVGDAYVRECVSCGKRVRYCQNLEVFRKLRAAGELAVLDPPRDVVERFLKDEA